MSRWQKERKKLYQWKVGSRMAGGKTGAKKVGAELERLRRQHKFLTPQIVLAAAKSVNSPLHRYFTWDDKAAAKKYRLSEASKIIRSIEIVVIDVAGQESQHRSFYTTVEIGSDKAGVYVAAEDGLSDKQMQKLLLKRAQQEAQIFIDKYGNMKVLAKIMKTMRSALAALKRAI